ncbi:UDP-2-acetamido-2,6-beta-L-arabino-hexul-4-ose reductase [Georgenia soli]|uniref:UDP-2-acetamido-2,6-beta-L-arabino-hexul-4-ose reductase n=1 Tax=Georgenia soli TaxID=638953 RepID=A0A2A9EK77_9MICO|nr:NAD-dependent epimerase/dehydratase family protein [Georgenia soli]PFG39016.1 UDP-2-acetamido-2,6-beta-L-arabino-hexul-4-ose reductase [Georgenia soli]
MKVVVTGAAGFLGFHTRARLRALTQHVVIPIDRSSWSQLPSLVDGADAVIHIAGVNRGEPSHVENGNIELGRRVAQAIRRADTPPRHIVYANSIQAGNASPYGNGKASAGSLLQSASQEAEAQFTDVRLPNLFGEHGRPQYNSFVATFAHAVINGERPRIEDRPVSLLHAQEAAATLINSLETPQSLLTPTATPTSVQAVYAKLSDFNDTYQSGEIPALDTKLDLELFNTLRAARFPSHYPIALPPRTDVRGTLTELVRAQRSQGQTFVSTTKSGYVRGEHFHLRKIERFVVLSGSARISLRRLFSDEVVSFDVSGNQPVAIDMPTMWAHNITNTDSSDLVTMFWTNELFDPSDTDTFPEQVEVGSNAPTAS